MNSELRFLGNLNRPTASHALALVRRWWCRVMYYFRMERINSSLRRPPSHGVFDRLPGLGKCVPKKVKAVCYSMIWWDQKVVSFLPTLLEQFFRSDKHPTVLVYNIDSSWISHSFCSNNRGRVLWKQIESPKFPLIFLPHCPLSPSTLTHLFLGWEGDATAPFCGNHSSSSSSSTCCIYPPQ